MDETKLNDKRLPEDTVFSTDPKGKFWVRAYTHNWAGDVFVTNAKTLEEAVQKTIKNIKADGKDLWMIKEN